MKMEEGYMFYICSAIFCFYLFLADIRVGDAAKSIQPRKEDRGTTKFNLFATALIALIPILVRHGPLRMELGHFRTSSLDATTGALLATIVIACLLRFWSMRVLGRYFTRTLLVQEDQKIIQSGPYSVVLFSFSFSSSSFSFFYVT